jgi:hypothetical protein
VHPLCIIAHDVTKRKMIGGNKKQNTEEKKLLINEASAMC